jgi:predicted nuclease of restriction endonuclease-like (RecB) superfamily
MHDLINLEYKSTLETLILRVKQAQYNALKAFSTEKVQMAWDLGKIISEKVKSEKWGDGVINNLSKDLQIEFAGVTGFSTRNLRRMKLFYETYKDSLKVAPMVAKISWSNNVVIVESCKDKLEAEFYIQKSISNGWSKYDLADHIKRGLYQNSLLAQNNFERTMEVSDEVKRRVAFDFRDDMGIELINGENPFSEKEIEDTIMRNLNDFLLAMEGKFSFVGRQVKLVLNEKEFFIDLLFYHFELNCYVVLELKATEFKPEHLGQLQGYLTLVDRLKKSEAMNRTIGILVCKNKDRLLVEYLLSDTNYPVGIATIGNKKYSELGEDLKHLLPSEEEISKRLSNLELTDQDNN